MTVFGPDPGRPVRPAGADRLGGSAEFQARLPSTGPLLAAIGGVMALLLVAVVVAVILTIDLRAAAARADQHVEFVNAINFAALNAKGIANDERGFLISGRSEFIREINQRSRDAREALSVADRAAVGNAQRRAVYEVRDGFERWFLAVQDDIDTYRSGAQKAAIASSLGRTRDLRKANEADIERARTLGESAVEGATTSLTAASWRSVRILLVYLVVALAVAALLTVWLVRTVLKPVDELRQLLPESNPVRSLH